MSKVKSEQVSFEGPVYKIHPVMDGFIKSFKDHNPDVDMRKVRVSGNIVFIFEKD